MFFNQRSFSHWFSIFLLYFVLFGIGLDVLGMFFFFVCVIKHIYRYMCVLGRVADRRFHGCCPGGCSMPVFG